MIKWWRVEKISSKRIKGKVCEKIVVKRERGEKGEGGLGEGVGKDV